MQIWKHRIIRRFCETAHLPLPQANINTNSHLAQNVGQGEG